MSVWDKLIEDVAITLNLRRQSKAHPHLSAEAHCDELLKSDTALMGPARCHVLIHECFKNRQVWGFNAIEGFCTGPALYHRQNFTAFPNHTRAVRTSDTVNFSHDSITMHI